MVKSFLHHCALSKLTTMDLQSINTFFYVFFLFKFKVNIVCPFLLALHVKYY